MKHEWRKHEKEIYLPKKKPTILDLPKMQYITIEGSGVPGDEMFSNCVQALYSLSYPIKMTLKQKNPDNDYTVYPLEGFWDLDEKGRELYTKGSSIVELKGHMVYKMMIRQPNFVSKEFFNQIKDNVYNNKKNDFVLKTKLETIEEGLVCQMTHAGSYDNEPASFKLMEEYCEENGYKRLYKTHKEIYISNPVRTAPEKLKTTIRFQIKKEA